MTPRGTAACALALLLGTALACDAPSLRGGGEPTPTTSDTAASAAAPAAALPTATPAGTSLLDLLAADGALERAAWSTPRVMSQKVGLDTASAPGFVKLRVPSAGAVLEAAYGVKPERWADVRSGPFRFAIAVLTPRRNEDRGGREIVFERRIDPAREPADRRWHEARVDLDPYAGTEILLAFLIDTPKLVEPPGDLAGWRDPRIVPRTEDGGQTGRVSPDGKRRNAETPTR